MFLTVYIRLSGLELVTSSRSLRLIPFTCFGLTEKLIQVESKLVTKSVTKGSRKRSMSSQKSVKCLSLFFTLLNALLSRLFLASKPPSGLVTASSTPTPQTD